ncbi:MAG: PD40 domain-containing protein [Verrucomicrobiae bacterium]|nr:PD40 domain-containing protein [Verrucomicrobiae bacterium]
MLPSCPIPLSRRRWLGLMTAAIPAVTLGQNQIVISRLGGPAPIPIALTGYTGEAAAVLRFDLEIAGCRIVPESEAHYTLAAGSGTRLEGRLTDRGGTVLLGRAYTAGTPRQQAHALSDDVVQALGGRGIAQTRIAFKCELSQGKSEIFVSDYDGHGAQQVTRDGSIVAAPTWVPGKLTLLYTSYRLGNPDIFLHDLSSGSRRPFSRQAGLNTSATVSADGQRVAMILSKDGSPNLYVSHLDGSGLTRLTNNRQGDSSPCWSPDNRTLCYSSRSGGPSTLYTLPASGGTPRRLRLAGVTNGTEPDWSPDGQQIAFTTQRGGGFEICVVPANGGDVTALVPGEDPVWAPNSRNIVYTRRHSGGVRALSLLDVPTRQTKDLPRLSGSCSQPTWAR